MENVFLFAPNIIGELHFFLISIENPFFVLLGYIRVITLIISLYYMPTTPDYAAFFYLLSNFLDAFDGMAARRFNQCK